MNDQPENMNFLKKIPKKLTLIVIVIFLAGIVFYVTQLRNHSGNDAVKAGNLVEIIINEDTGFTPSTATIKAGDTVSWRSKDEDHPRQVAANPYPSRSSLPDLFSPELTMDRAYSFRFTASGTYRYHDFLHPEVNGVIIVE